MNIGDILKSLEVPAGAVEELAGIFGKTEAGQVVVDLLNHAIDLEKRLQALVAPPAAAAPEEAPAENTRVG